MLPNLPPEVRHRLEGLAGARLVLHFDPVLRPLRAVLHFEPLGAPPLQLLVEQLSDATWPFARAPQLRVPWRFAAPVRSVQLLMAQRFDRTPPTQVVRVEVELEGAPALALEGVNVNLGPVFPVNPAASSSPLSLPLGFGGGRGPALPS